MAKVSYYPAKQKKRRVQFSADELEALCNLVREKVKDQSVPFPEAEKLVGMFAKLSRARRAVAD